MDRDVRKYLKKAQEQQDSGALQSAYNIINETTAGSSGRSDPELYVLCAETALQLGCSDIGTLCLKMFFEHIPPANQFLCRAFVCQGQLKSPPVTGKAEDFEDAVLCFLRAIDISKQEPRNHFMVFNASVLYFQTVRPLMQPGRRRHLISSLKQVVQSLEEVADQDHIWRAELMMHLIECLVDSGEMEEARNFAKRTEEFVKTHVPHLYPKVFALMMSCCKMPPKGRGNRSSFRTLRVQETQQQQAAEGNQADEARASSEIQETPQQAREEEETGEETFESSNNQEVSEPEEAVSQPEGEENELLKLQEVQESQQDGQGHVEGEDAEPSEFQEQVRSESDILLEQSRQSTTLMVIYKIQLFKRRLRKSNPEAPVKEDLSELEEIFHLLADGTEASTTTSPQITTPLQPANRIAFLLELALLALQVKHQKVAVNCLKALKSVEEASIGQRILMECINCEINVLKKEKKMNDYSKASVEAWLTEIGKLDRWLQTAVKEGDPAAVQAVCAAQWSLCLPFLQRNLRRRIKSPLFRVAQALEDMQSPLLEMRCQVHSELAVTEEEDGHIETSLTHLQKAMLLDNGTLRESLSSAFHLLQLRGTLHHIPTQAEDRAAMLMQQARDMPHQQNRDIRPALVAVGLLLAPSDFQIVLDADNTSKMSVDTDGCGPMSQLCAEAQHHSASVQRLDGHLAQQGQNTDNTERMKLWATLVKTARKQEIWDVCRAACRFCLLYDDGRWKISKSGKCRCSEDESCVACLQEKQVTVKNLRLLAEVHFITAEAYIQKLHTRGLQFNKPVAPIKNRGVYVSDDDPQWVIYRDWIQGLSASATSNFLRAAELGTEIKEPWLIANAAIYLWNYSRHLLVVEEYQHLLPTFQFLVGLIRKTDYTSNHTLLVLLCDVVARGLIQPLCRQDCSEQAPPGNKVKNKAERGTEKSTSVQGCPIDPAAVQDVRKALELCDLALRISNGNQSGETVPIAARKQVVATWVQIKRLLQQQIGPKMDMDYECHNKLSAVTRVLVGVEMLQCNRNPKHMEFSVPNLSTLVSTAFECIWTDAVVELQVWCQLASSCHHVEDHSLVLSCTKRALQLEEAATKCLNTTPCVLYGLPAINEMLSSAACLRGLSLANEAFGNLQHYMEAMGMLLSAVSYAKEAENPVLCLTAARHYWNACLHLTHTPEERRRLKEPLEIIMKALVHFDIKHTNIQGKMKNVLPVAPQPLENSRPEVSNEEVQSLRTAIYTLLIQIYSDTKDWKGARRLLENAIRDMPRSRHRLTLLRYYIQMKARLGESIAMDMKKLEDEGEHHCSFMWHQAATCSCSITQQLTYYQKSITSFLNGENTEQKVSLLLEFGEWLYCHNFPKDDAQLQVQCAIDVLLHLETQEDDGSEDANSVKCEPLAGMRGSSFIQSLSALRDVQRLDNLVRAHTLLAVMAGRTSPEHQQNLLRAYTFVLQIWQVSMAVVVECFKEMTGSQPPQVSVSADPKKDKGKNKKPPPAEEKPKPNTSDLVFPSTLEDWTRYSLPDQIREIIRTNSDSQCINIHSIAKQTQSLFYLNLLEAELHSLSLSHLTLPVLHLAETIAHDLLDGGTLSDLYRLKIVRTCCHLGMEAHSPYHEMLLSLSAKQEKEQLAFYKAITLSRERRNLHIQKRKSHTEAQSWQWGMDLCSPDIWIDKAEVCLGLGLYIPARQLLTEAHQMASELGNEATITRSLLSLAILACKEQNHAQALCLLDEAQALEGDEDFWYKFTLTKVRATSKPKELVTQTKINQIVNQGCAALKLLLEQHVNKVPKITYLMTSLEMRGAIECIHEFNERDPTDTLCPEDVQMLIAACETLKLCANVFTKLNYREEAAKSFEQCTHALRILANCTTDALEKQRFLLKRFSYMQSAIMEQEHVVLNAQNLLPPQEESSGMILSATHKLIHLRVALAEFCLTLLEERCEEEKCQALARESKNPAKIALEEFTRATPELDSTEEKWILLGGILGQVALAQLVAVSSLSSDNVETRARCLSLMGKGFRLEAAQTDPLYLSSLWNRNLQSGAGSDSDTVEESSQKDKDSVRKEPMMISSKIAEQQQKRLKAEQLLSKAKKVLAESVRLCLQHKLPSPITTEAALNLLECLGQSEPDLAGQYLALFQSGCAAAMMAELLSSACSDVGASQLSALLSLQRNLSQDERPCSMLKKVEDSLIRISKAFSHLSISPKHLNILAELPLNMKILLLQHSKDGSELYGALYKLTSSKGKMLQGSVMCTRVAKASVCPRALLALRERTRAFGREKRRALLKESRWQHSEGRVETPQENRVSRLASPGEIKLNCFKEIVQHMEQYLNPLLKQFDFSLLRPHKAPAPHSSMTKLKDKEDKQHNGKGTASSVCSDKSPLDVGEFVVLLADRKLLELPLEALSVLQDESLRSVSRDFSLQLLHSRLPEKECRKADESENKKESKGGKKAKGKPDQSQAIKRISPCSALSSHTSSVSTKNFTYIVNPYNDSNVDGPSLGKRMKKILEPYIHLLEGFMGCPQTPSVCEVQQLLYKSSGFIYLGTENFLANIPPAKLAALNLSGCHLALLFDRVQKNASAVQQWNPDMQKSAGKCALNKPLETALLLSLGGVGCIILSQWHSSIQQTTRSMTSILDNLLRVRQTSGQTIHLLRRGHAEKAETPHHKVTGTHDEVSHCASKKDDLHHETTLTHSSFNCVLYGLPNVFAT